MNTQKVYLISKDTVQNIPDAMIGTGLLTIKNMGLFASIEIVDSNKQQVYLGRLELRIHHFIKLEIIILIEKVFFSILSTQEYLNNHYKN